MGNRRVRLRGRAADVFGGALTALLSFTIVPVVLVLVVGNPLGGGLGHDWRPLSRDTMCVLVAVAWVAWAACCTQLVRTVAHHVRRGSVAPLPSRSVLDRVAARIAVGVLAFSSLGTPLALASGAGATTPVGDHVVVRAAVRVGSGTGSATSSARVSAGVHVVRTGESLWSIAEKRMEDGADWTSIAALNLGRRMSGADHFVDPDQLRAGWRLRLPESARAAQRGRLPPPGAGAPPGSEDPVGSHLPELLALGLGSLTCAAIARRTRRHRECDRYHGELDLQALLSDAAVDTETLVNRFAGTPALAAFESANMLLGRRLEDRAKKPRVRAISVGPEGVTFWLSKPDEDAPDDFDAGEDGGCWRVAHVRLHSVEPFTPWVAVALPVGDDGTATWLVAVDAGSVVPVLGESADDLCRAACAAQRAWAWADAVQVTDTPAAVLAAFGGERSPNPVIGGTDVLFLGDPRTLDTGLTGRVAVITTAAVPASDVTVLVDRHGATIHPIGRVLRPHLLSAERWRLVDEITSGPDEQQAAASKPSDTACETAQGRQASTPLWATADRAEKRRLAPGPVDVRLLTATPRLDGLEEELPPNRARRAVELVAYLALHDGDVITSDRLRTRVLGSSDADAASKTLFNVAHAARRAMGVGADGMPLFPAGSRNGLYQVSPEVTVDVHRALAFAAEGKECAHPELAMAHFRAALELVEGEPFVNALSGYSWWESEGHGARMGSVLVDAACFLAELATDAGLFGLAWLGLDRALLVAPYSEALSRAAMAVAAEEGDADRLRHEWRECQRRVDALDPGSSPSTRTESLYGELTRRIVVKPTGDPVSALG